jgi:hypothetical protein
VEPEHPLRLPDDPPRGDRGAPATLTVRDSGPHEAETSFRIQKAASLAALAHVFPPEEFPYPDDAVRARWQEFPGRVFVAERDGVPAGWAVTSPWGAGVAICARDATAGMALVASATSGPGSSTLVVPNANTDAADALGHWGFSPTAAGARMRLGPPVAWQPEMQFGLFNLFWG